MNIPNPLSVCELELKYREMLEAMEKLNNFYEETKRNLPTYKDGINFYKENYKELLLRATKCKKISEIAPTEIIRNNEKGHYKEYKKEADNQKKIYKRFNELFDNLKNGLKGVYLEIKDLNYKKKKHNSELKLWIRDNFRPDFFQNVTEDEKQSLYKKFVNIIEQADRNTSYLQALRQDIEKLPRHPIK
jgi:hypothetical protein